jgi:energy-coupling factor transporter ATP-binding protein EcfA2
MMPIQSFNITNVKIVNKASCENVPKLMIIAGRNGIGKSTLLYELRRLSGDRVKGTGKILYAGPHRSWRRRQIRSTWLWSKEKDYFSILQEDSIPGFEGVHLLDNSRRPDTTDEAPGFIKYILAQIETRRQNAIVAGIDDNNLKYPDGYAPDVYKPLKEMLSILLPHLSFLRVDQSNRENVGCLMCIQGTKDPIDIDDLSSGEKEVIALFMPLLERQINQIIRVMQKGEKVDLDVAPDTIMVLDEPDLHIHPELQKRMLSYMRKRAYEDNVQFIIATHSPIIINEAGSDELYSLIPRDIAIDDNQLRKVISSQQKLDLFKDTCGDVAILTLGRPIVFIEGKAPDEVMKKVPSDQRLLELLWQGASNFTFVPAGGKKEVSKAANLLNQIISERLFGLPTYAIVDTDLEVEIDPSSPIRKWDCCTIENALLDPQSIIEVLQPYREKIGVSSVNEIESKLLDICNEMKQEEIHKRLKKLIPSFQIEFRGNSIEKLEQEREEGIKELRKRFANKTEISGLIQNTTKEVEEMISNKTALLKFDGKKIIGKLYNEMVSSKGIGMSFDVFCYSVAERIGNSGRTPESITKTLTSIQNQVNINPKPI